MDEVNIGTKFMQGILIKIIKKVVKEKTGVCPELLVNDPIKMNFDGNTVRIHLNLDAELGKEDLQKLLKDLV